MDPLYIRRHLTFTIAKALNPSSSSIAPLSLTDFWCSLDVGSLNRASLSSLLGSAHIGGLHKCWLDWPKGYLTSLKSINKTLLKTRNTILSYNAALVSNYSSHMLSYISVCA